MDCATAMDSGTLQDNSGDSSTSGLDEYGLDAYHKWKEFAAQMCPRLRKVPASAHQQYLGLAEEFRLFHNEVHVVRVCPLGIVSFQMFALCEFDLLSLRSQEWSTHHWQSLFFHFINFPNLPKLKVMVGSLTESRIDTLTYAHSYFGKLFKDSLPPGFDLDEVDEFLDGYAYALALERRRRDEAALQERFHNLDNQILGQLARLDDLDKEIRKDAADLDEEVEERDCQQRHPEGPTSHQISVKARRCDFRSNRATLAASAAHAACAASASRVALSLHKPSVPQASKGYKPSGFVPP